MKVVNAEALIKWIQKCGSKCPTISVEKVFNMLKDAPTVDTKELWGLAFTSGYNYAKAEMGYDWEEPKINPCRGCEDYDGRGGCKSNGGCAEEPEYYN